MLAFPANDKLDVFNSGISWLLPESFITTTLFLRSVEEKCTSKRGIQRTEPKTRTPRVSGANLRGSPFGQRAWTGCLSVCCSIQTHYSLKLYCQDHRSDLRSNGHFSVFSLSNTSFIFRCFRDTLTPQSPPTSLAASSRSLWFSPLSNFNVEFPGLGSGLLSSSSLLG